MRVFKGLGIEKAVARIILVQVLLTFTVSLLLVIVADMAIAASAFAGGAVGFLTSLVYATKMRVSQGNEAKKVIRAHYNAEAYKLIFTILLFSFIFTQFKDVHALPLFATYIATLAVYWAALIFV
ncbi:MAG: ATP synthase subunit I [Gallionellaceae bacterium]|jgi:ATP synthase protein I